MGFRRKSGTVSIMKLAVITHTAGNREEFLYRCKNSVKNALPEAADHRIIKVNNFDKWARSRVESIADADLFAFVDDDDYISKESLNILKSAIIHSGLGSACTDELLVDINGNKINDIYYNKSYNYVSKHPRVAHHLFMFRKECFDSSIIKYVDEYGLFIDWILKGSIINTYGCSYVPIIGYFWTQHESQTTKLYNKSEIIKNVPDLLKSNWPEKFKGNFTIYSNRNGILI